MFCYFKSLSGKRTVVLVTTMAKKAMKSMKAMKAMKATKAMKAKKAMKSMVCDDGVLQVTGWLHTQTHTHTQCIK